MVSTMRHDHHHPWCVEEHYPFAANPSTAKASSSLTLLQIRRTGSDRYLLSPELVADYLVNNGLFVHEDATYIDHNHRETNNKMLNRLLGKGLMAAMRYVSPTEKGLADVIDTLKYYPLSPKYEFALDDAVRLSAAPAHIEPL